jgi:sialic acid synthase SpsE/sugar phosphate isomerase/epimerase
VNSLTIGNFEISREKSFVFVIAEIGNNHNGSFKRAIEMVDLAVEAGANCVKFQMRNLEEVYRKKTLQKSGDDLSTEYTVDLLKKFELSIDQHTEIANYCKKKGVLYLCTPWDKKSIQVLESIGVVAYKVASADFTNIPLIDLLIATKKPMILSTGMSSEEEIIKIVSYLNSRSAQFALLHCNSTYPAPFHGINLNYIKRLAQHHDLVGYSGHERGTAVSIAAVALGAKIVERHFTLDRDMEGPDHAASLEVKEFKELVSGIREVELALGKGDFKVVSQGEMINRENLAKSIVAARELKAGEVIQRSDLMVKSPGLGLSPMFMEDLLGKKISRNMKEEDYFFKSDLGATSNRAREYRFERLWGVPVRYHDFDKFTALANPPLVEFHLSYSDMNLNLGDFFKGQYDCEYVVHAPELFSDSHLMDLATDDDTYRAISMKETQRTIDITRALKKYFPKTKKPLIVANVGGFSRDGNISEEQKTKAYDRFYKSLKELDTEGVEIIPQTMAPFPWHFGGQRFQNIFVHPDEIVTVCKKFNLRMCLDISHSFLVANHFNYNFNEFVEKLAPYVAHLHMGDSVGVDGEGLQIGQGEIDFESVCEILNRKCPKASFIPEIWQGHKNDGEGFWVALEKLEGALI